MLPIDQQQQQEERDMEERAKAFGAHYGLEEAEGWPLCLCRLLGKEHDEESEICSVGGVPLDHCSLWLKNGHAKMFVSQPYKAKIDLTRLGSQLEPLCRKYPLIYRVSAEESYYRPGETVMIIVECV